MIIDWHTHVHTPDQMAQDFWQGRCPMTIENVLDAQDQAGIDMAVISNPLHELRHMDRVEQLATMGNLNRYLAEQQGQACREDRRLRELRAVRRR